MSEYIREGVSITDHEEGENFVSPLSYSFVFMTLLIGAVLTVAAAKLQIGVFKRVL